MPSSFISTFTSDSYPPAPRSDIELEISDEDIQKLEQHYGEYCIITGLPRPFGTRYAYVLPPPDDPISELTVRDCYLLNRLQV